MEIMQETDGIYPGEHPAKPQTSFDAALPDAIPTAIYTCDAQGRITYFNEAAAKLWGRTPQIGKEMLCGSWKIYDTAGNILPADSWPMAETLKEHRAVSGREIIIERPDGSQSHILPHPQPLFDHEGTFTGAVNMLMDVTELKRKEALIHEKEEKYRSLAQLLEKKVEERTQNLKNSEERYHKMIEEVQDYAILLLDINGYILNWNKGAEKIKGYSEKEIIGKNFRLFYREQDRIGQLPEKIIEIALTEGRASHEGWRVRKDGSEFWGSVVITALHNDSGNVIGFSKVTRDLTERKLAEDRLNNYAMDIELRNKQLEEYAYIASHDLQEPLRKIQIFSELLERSIDDPEAVKRNLAKITSSAQRMGSLIKDVLKYSQLSHTGELFTDVDLNKIIETVKEDFDLLIEQRTATISYSGLGIIKGIPIQMHQLFSNLVSNAIKFSDKNPVIEITGELLSSSEVKQYPGLNSPAGHIKIIFKDNGVGFEQQYSEQVFRMFRRLSENTGTGIGLALCKKIIENHNGHIDVESKPGKGTAFTVLLPVSH